MDRKKQYLNNDTSMCYPSNGTNFQILSTNMKTIKFPILAHAFVAYIMAQILRYSQPCSKTTKIPIRAYLYVAQIMEHNTNAPNNDRK